MKHINFIIGFALIPLSASAIDFGCKYSLDPQSVKIGWTAFKTTEKTPVKGTIKDSKVQTPPKPTKSLSALLTATKADGQIDHQDKSDSGNPARDTTLFQKFFHLLWGYAKYEGSFDSIKGDDHAGTMNLALHLNKIKNEVPMTYKLGDDGAFEASGEFDMTKFGMDAALASLHKECETLHTGKDGVSKTWPNVGLTLTAKVTKNCTK